GDFSRLAHGCRGRRALRTLPRRAVPVGRGLRHRAARGGGGRPADDRAGAGRGARDHGRTGRGGLADRGLLRPPDGGGPRGGHRDLRGERVPLRAGGAACPRGAFRPAALRARAGRVGRRPVGGGGARMLKAHSRLFEHLALVTDLVIIVISWIGAYALRFYVFGHGGIPPFSGYALQLLPILVVWSFAYRAFDLYRPHRLGSHLAEWADIAKASTLGVLVLIALMTFAFRSYDYSRIVILTFWAVSIVGASLSRAVFREALRVARRHGYNQRYAVLVGG